ncbi:MAG: type II secretion system F family protein [Pseudomonadota bacterium]
MTENSAFIAALATFLTVLLAGSAVYLFTASRERQVERRLGELKQTGKGSSHSTTGSDGDFMVRWMEPVGGMIMPDSDWQKSTLQRALVLAGYRRPSAMYILLASKLILALATPLLVSVAVMSLGNGAFLMEAMGLALVALLSFIGFMLPDYILARKASKRREHFTEAFPDALDMLVVCVEAGLGLDAAINRVARELRLSYPMLAQELELTSAETRAGKGRVEALQAMADRMDIDQAKSLVSLLIQAERYGTSIGSALRIYAEEMRVDRIQRAKTKAAKLPTQLLVPVVVFIFPALFLVVLGPAVISIFDNLQGL